MAQYFVECPNTKLQFPTYETAVEYAKKTALDGSYLDSAFEWIRVLFDKDVIYEVMTAEYYQKLRQEEVAKLRQKEVANND